MKGFKDILPCLLLISIHGILGQRSDFPFPPVTNNNIFGNTQQRDREPPRDLFGSQTPNPRDPNNNGNSNNNNNFNTNSNNNNNFNTNNNFNDNFNTNTNNNQFDNSRTPVRPDRPRTDTFNPFSTRRDPFGSGAYTPRLDISDPSFTYSAGNEEKRCPERWDTFKDSCYRFVQSPTHTRVEAQRNCQAYGNEAELLSLNSLEEHMFIVRKLMAMDIQHRTWYISTREVSPGSWTNADGTQMVNMDQAFLQDQPLPTFNIPYQFLAYSFSDRRQYGIWGLLKVTGQEPFQYICEIPLSRVPYILIDDRDFEYGLEVTDLKKIPRGPNFIMEPKSEVFDISRALPLSYVSLSCVSGGWPAPTYEWFKEEYRNNSLVSIKIDPLKNTKYTVSGGSLIIHEPKQKEDRGSYHCVATNQFGSIISESVSLSFGYIAEFILQRTTEYANQFWGKAIYCDPPQHFPGIHYYWSRDYFPNFLEEDQRVFVSYDGNLYISSVDMSDSGTYSCNVQSVVSDSGRNGPLFNLRVIPHGNHQQLKFPNNFPKVYPEAPKAGDSVRLECVAFGYPVPAYNWTRRGSGLPRNAILSNYNRVITLRNVTINDQGEYTCRATNSRLFIESSVQLRIQAAPDFIIPIGDKHMDKGADLTWMCEAFGIPDVSYQWYRDGRPLTRETLPPRDIGRYVIQDNVLTIRELDEEQDAGMYQCRANNSLAARYSSGQLRVLLLRPSFKKRPVDPEILGAEGGNVTIRCNPEAAPRPRFNWRKDGNMIGVGGRRRILPSGALFINPVSREDQGLYTCIAQNSLGTAESSGRLTVLRGPVLIEPLPDRIQTAVGSQLSLRCRADADDALDIAYIWKHNGLRINETIDRVRMDSRSGFLDVFNISLADRGDYECEVLTWVGQLRSISRVEIRGPPGPPGGVEAIDLSATNATVQWTDGAMHGSLSYLYSIQGRTQWEQKWMFLIENVTAYDADRVIGGRLGSEANRKEIKIGGALSPWCTYEFRVIAANEYGYGPPSAPSPQYNTLPAPPSKAPENVGGGGGKTNSLTVTWSPMSPQDQNGPGVFYKIFWRRFRTDNTEEEFQSQVLRQWGNIGQYVVSVPSQYYYTLYQVKVQAFNDIGPGPVSNISMTYTAEDMPQATPTFVYPMPYNSTAINVTWTPVDQAREKIRGKLLGYRIRYWQKKDNNLYDTDAINYLSRFPDRPWALILGLQPNTYYYVQVMAYNSAGPGPASEPIFERTLKKAPQKPPTAVNVRALDLNTIVVTWRYVAPSIEEETLAGYKVRIWEADQDIATAYDRDTIIPIESRTLEATIEDLKPGKTYVLRVLAYSAGGDGKMSSPATEFVLGDTETLRSGGTKPAVGSRMFIIVMISIVTALFYLS